MAVFTAEEERLCLCGHMRVAHYDADYYRTTACRDCFESNGKKYPCQCHEFRDAPCAGDSSGER